MIIRRKIVFIALKEWVEDVQESHASRVSLARPVLSPSACYVQAKTHRFAKHFW